MGLVLDHVMDAQMVFYCEEFSVNTTALLMPYSRFFMQDPNLCKLHEMLSVGLQILIVDTFVRLAFKSK